MINKKRLVDSKLVLRKEKLFYCSFIFIIIWELCSFIILSYIGYNFISNAYAVEKYSLEGFFFFYVWNNNFECFPYSYDDYGLA